MNSDFIKEQKFFIKNGYIVYPNFFKNKSSQLINRINKIFNLDSKKRINKKYGAVDGITFNELLWELIIDKDLLKKIKILIGNDYKYIRHSDIHVNYGGGVFHRDCANRIFNKGPDWDEEQEKYSVLRVAIYLTDFKKTKSSLIVVPGTHKKQSKLTSAEIKFNNFIRSKLRKLKLDRLYPHFLISKKLVKIKTNPGDLIIFDQRLLHAGGNTTPYFMPKYSIFLGYGKRNNHTLNHENFYKLREGYKKPIPEKLKILLNNNKLL